MQIWIDGDACPGDVKQVLFRAAERRGVMMTLVANQPMSVPPSKYLRSLLVPAGANVADARIVELMAPGDLVITADIPLASQVVAKGGQALDPRGMLYHAENIGERIAMRDLLDELRGGGLISGGPAQYNSRNRQDFANQLDRWMTRALRGSPPQTS